MNILYLAYVKEITHYIKDELEYDHVKNNENGIYDYLKSIQYKDISEIAENMINDDWLNEQLNTVIAEYLYKNFKGDEK